MNAETPAHATGYGSWDLFRTMWRLFKGNRLKFAIATVLQFSSYLVWLYPAYALSYLVNFLKDYQPGQSWDPIVILFAVWAAVSAWHYFSEQVAEYLGYRMAERIALDAQLRTVTHLLQLDLAWHERENAGNKLKRIEKGGEGINRIVRIWFDNTISALVNFFGMIPILAAFDYTVAGVTLFFLVTYFLFSRYFTRKAGDAAYAVNLGEEDLQGVAFEALNNVRSVKVLGMQEGLLGIITARVTELLKKIYHRVNRFRIREITLQVWAQAFRIGTTGFIVYGVLQGRYNVGFLVLFYTYFNYIWESIDRLSRVALDFVISKYGVIRMTRILEEPILIDAEGGKTAFPKEWDELTVKNLSFAYGKKEVLHDLSFTIRRGERIGIVGVSGAGKSTLFKLLLKEHENYQGEIRFGSTQLRDIRRSDFFRQTAVVLQDTEVFNFTLRDNITLASIQHAEDKARLQQAIEVAHVTDFLKKMPLGLETEIGEKGIRLSGGEKQRVGIARAVFKQPDLLFLDEATSHLDLESEENIRDSLHKFFQSVTAVVIAHRLSTIKEMDRILVLEAGRIIEEGTFDQLYAKKGRFHELWEKQKF
jgi:ABC-type multidrug transport system fused ATPase/permease subunit